MMIGAMKAKLLPRKMGTLPLVTRWKRRVPIPAEKRAVDGSSPTRMGTRTVAPKATNRYWGASDPLTQGAERGGVRGHAFLKGRV